MNTIHFCIPLSPVYMRVCRGRGRFIDEPTAALDPKAEYMMYKNFNSLVEGKLTLYISHRMSSSRFCDYVLVFSDGAIIEEGTHEELMKLKKVYSSLYSMQAQFYLD